MADETLNIRVKATDETKGALASAKQGFTGIGKSAEVANTKVQTATKKTGKELEVLARRQKIVSDLFGEFGTKLPIFLFADLAARVAGFTSLMDALTKSLDATADKAERLVEIVFFEGADRSWMTFARDRFKDLGDEINRVEDEALGASVHMEALGEVFTLNAAEADSYHRQLLLLSKATDDLAAKTEEFTPAFIFPTINEDGKIRLKTIYEEDGASEEIEKERVRLLGELERAIRNVEKAETQRRVNASKATSAEKKRNERMAEWNAALAEGARRSEEAAQKQTLLNVATLGQAQAFLVLAGVLAKAGTEEEERRANEQARVDRLKAEFDARAEKTVEAIALDKEAKLAAEDLDAAYQAARNSALQAHAQIVRAAEDSKDMGLGFSEGTKSAREFFGTLREEGQKLGEQAVFGGFDAMRGFFRDILDGAVDAEEALKNFGRSAIGVAADLLAQFAALRVLDFLFPGLGAGLSIGSRASGGIESGGIQSFAMGGIPDGGGITGPRLVAVGDNAERSEAILPLRRGPSGRLGVESAGGGGGSTINLTVNSLDPRTAADVVLAQMPQIQRALATSLSKGSTRALNLATKGAQL